MEYPTKKKNTFILKMNVVRNQVQQVHSTSDLM